jgi:hypothetical protein
MIPTNKVVQINISTVPSLILNSNFSTLLLVESATYLPTGQRLRSYPSLAAVAADHPTTSAAYAAATIFFDQTPGATLLIGRRFNAATAGELIGGAYDAVLADWKAITAGSLTLPINGTNVNLTGLNFSAATSLSGVAAIIQTALTTALAGATITYTGGYFYVQSSTTGASSSVGFAATPPSGTDISAMAGLQSAQNGTATNGAIAETMAGSLTALAALNQSWYGLAFTNEIVDADILNIGGWAEANQRLFQHTTQEAGSTSASSTTDIGAQLQALSYKWSSIIYDPLIEYAAVGYLARLMAVDFTQARSTITMAFKNLVGITPSNLTLAQSQVLDSKNINYFSWFGAMGSQVAIVMNGTQASGMFTDIRQGLDWLSAWVQVAVFNYLLTNTKVPQTDKGVQRIVNVINRALAQGRINGLIADGGIWNGNPVGTKKTGDTLSNGYYVYASPIGSQSQATFSIRQAPPITILAIGAGAIQGVNIQLNWQ